MGTDFDDWLRTHSNSRRSVSYAWDRWPTAAREEIDAVFGLNRDGKTRISLLAMAKRLQDCHGLRVSETTLRRYVEAIHGARWGGEAIE